MISITSESKLFKLSNGLLLTEPKAQFVRLPRFASSLNARSLLVEHVNGLFSSSQIEELSE